MTKIPLTQGYEATIDDGDFLLVAPYNWCVLVVKKTYCTKVYALCRRVIEGRSTTIFMHQLISGLERPDHVDGNGLNNRRSNLRAATPSQNNQNTRHVRGSVPFKGVECLRGRFRVRVKLNGKRISVGSFGSAEDAARAYDTAAIKHFGEFAQTNSALGLL